jgi:multiple sugar transport system permease protein
MSLRTPSIAPTASRRARKPIWRRPDRMLLYAALAFWTVVVYLPLYWVVITSFKAPVAVAQGTMLPWIDFQPTLAAWKSLFSGIQSTALIRAYTNSLLVSIGSAVITTFIGAMAGYGLNRFRYRIGPMANEDIAFWFVSQRMLPPVAVVLAYFLLYQNLGLLDTRFGLGLAYIGFNLPLVVWIMRDFFSQIPKDIEESAALDGASPWLIYWKIALPLATPGLAASFLLSLVFSFNEYLFALILTTQKAGTFPIMLASQVTGDSIRFWILSALALMNIIPAAAVMVLLERYLRRGLLVGSVK